ncbi:MAG TPA: NAD-dependent epimerase/dehydratase family protein [Candidatus Methylomirabilis sp.]|nr:NAD-dependent epimerase/dehydratase family protein [Candidatus Methylomirabilis sp.]
MKVLVTGGCGFLGSHVCELFLQKGWQAVSYDNMTKAELARTGYATDAARNHNWDYLKALGVQMVKADVCDSEALLAASEGCDYIVHTAAQPAMTISWEDPRLDLNTNVVGTFNVLETARARKIPIVNTSSIHVYGNAINETLKEAATSFTREPVSISEDHPVMVGEISPLHASKMSAEHYVRAFHDMYQLCAATFRFTGIYGERQFGGEDHGWVANFAIRSVFDQPLRVFGSGKQARDILYARDAAEAYWNFFQNPRPGTYNIGGGPETKISLLECISLIGELLGKEPKLQFEDERPGDMKYFVCDITRAREFGFSPKTSPREGVQRLLNWIQENRSCFHV